MCGATSATAAAASCGASRPLYQRRLPVRHHISDINDGFLAPLVVSASTAPRRGELQGRRVVGRGRSSRAVVSAVRAGCSPPWPLPFDVACRAPCRGPARRSPRPPCCSPTLSSPCTRAHFTPIKLTAHQAVAGLATWQGSAAGGPVCYPSAIPAGPARRQWPLRTLWYCIPVVSLRKWRDSLAGGQTGRRELLDVRIEFPEAFFLRLQTSE